MNKKHILIVIFVFGLLFGGVFLVSSKTEHPSTPPASIDEQEKEQLSAPQPEVDVSKPTIEEQEEKEQQAKRDQVQTIGITLEEFKERFNLNAEFSFSPFIIGDVTFVTGSEYDYFLYEFDSYHQIRGFITKETQYIHEAAFLISLSKGEEWFDTVAPLVTPFVLSIEKSSISLDDFNILLANLLGKDRVVTPTNETTYTYRTLKYTTKIDYENKVFRFSVKKIR